MQIVVKANPEQQQAFLAKGIPGSVQIIWHNPAIPLPAADAYFDFLFEEEGEAFEQIHSVPVFLNSVIEPCTGNRIRFNGWNGFWEREKIEITAADAQALEKGAAILNTLAWKNVPVANIPGMIAARVVSMIINEAYFGLEDEISSKSEIDTAMKLGTNYPYGPFEWSEKTGLPKIYALLKKLSETDSRYQPAAAMKKETENGLTA